MSIAVVKFVLSVALVLVAGGLVYCLVGWIGEVEDSVAALRRRIDEIEGRGQCRIDYEED